MLGLNLDSLPRTEISRMTRPITIAHVALLFCGAALHAQQPAAGTAPSAAAQQTESDEYTRYELLGPETASFKIFYEVTATTPGAKAYFNPIRKGARRATKRSTMR